MNKLAEILAHKQEEVVRKKEIVPFSILIDEIGNHPPTKDFASAIRSSGSDDIACIAEIKKASPSKGVLTKKFEPELIARDYVLGGARALSVLTDEKYFQGHTSDINRAKKYAALPILRKDFIIDEYQIYETRTIGADAMLLIVAALTDLQLQTFLTTANDLSLDCLVECHSKEEIERAVDCGAMIVGVNNRDLQTFTIDLDTSLNLKRFIPNTCCSVSESGIRNRHQVDQLREAGFDAFLVGEQLMKQQNRSTAVHELLHPV